MIILCRAAYQFSGTPESLESNSITGHAQDQSLFTCVRPKLISLCDEYLNSTDCVVNSVIPLPCVVNSVIPQTVW